MWLMVYYQSSKYFAWLFIAIYVSRPLSHYSNYERALMYLLVVSFKTTTHFNKNVTRFLS